MHTADAGVPTHALPPCRLSHSALWNLQREFFERQGVRAWADELVPHYITNTPYLAGRYVDLVLSWLRDRADEAALDRSQPLYLIELGGGSGRLAHHVLRLLDERDTDRELQGLRLIYVLTDAVRSNVNAWIDHPQLRGWAEEGVLEFAQFDAEVDAGLTLEFSGTRVQPGELANPTVVIANYVLDGLRNDLFRVGRDALLEGLVEIDTETAARPVDPANGLGGVRLSVRYAPATSGYGYYEDEAFNDLLYAYRDEEANGAILFPIGALQCIRALHALTRGQCLIIAADKGFHRGGSGGLIDGMPQVALHGSVSVEVNFDALRRYVTAIGGRWMSPTGPTDDLSVHAFQFGGRSPRAEAAWTHLMASFGPSAFYALRQRVLRDGRSATAWLSLLTLADGDAALLMDSVGRVDEALAAGPVTEEVRGQVRAIVSRTWEMYLEIGERRPLESTLAQLLYAVDDYGGALQFLKRALRRYGPDAVVERNIASCEAMLAGAFPSARRPDADRDA